MRMNDMLGGILTYKLKAEDTVRVQHTYRYIIDIIDMEVHTYIRLIYRTSPTPHATAAAPFPTLQASAPLLLPADVAPPVLAIVFEM